MPDEVVPPTPAPAAPAAPAAPPPVAAAPATPQPAAAPAPAELPPVPPGVDAWLTPRLTREREAGTKAALKEAGFSSVEEAKAAAAAAKAAADAKKSAEEKAAEFQTINAQLKGRAEAVTKILDEQAIEMLAGLTDAQKTAVREMAADDAPAEDRIKAIRVVRKLSSSLAPATTGTPTTTPAPAPATTPTTTPAPAADTAPGRTAPNGGTGSPPNHRAQYEELQKSNPFQAAKYAHEHPEAYKSA